MNYRHHFHAGNFADVMKHVLLVRLLRAMQAKEKGFLYLDTHAGRARYDLASAATGDSLARRPEWPDGIGRLWERAELPGPIAEYVSLVREFDRRSLNTGSQLQAYPGSPWIAQMTARPQDRLVVCEKHPEECAILRNELGWAPGVSVQEIDGYVAVRAMLPPPERRALVLIDPPFEAPDEFLHMTASLAEGLRRLPGGVFALWYPLTERARLENFFAALRELDAPPTLVAELVIAGEGEQFKMKGCGLVILNPPWRFDREAEPPLRFLAEFLRKAPGARGHVEWLVPEK